LFIFSGLGMRTKGWDGKNIQKGYEEIVFPRKENNKEIVLLVLYRGKRDLKSQRSKRE